MESVLEGRGRAPIARAGNRFTVMLPEKIQLVFSVQSFYNIAEIVFIYCWKRTVGLRQELSRESFDPRRGPPEKLRGERLLVAIGFS